MAEDERSNSELILAATVLHTVRLLRVRNGLTREVLTTLNSDIIPAANEVALNFAIREGLRGYSPSADRKLIQDLRKALRDPYNRLFDDLRDFLRKVSRTESTWIHAQFGKYITRPLTRPTSTDFVTDLPFEGRTLPIWIRSLERDLSDSIRDAVVMAVLRGESVATIEQLLRGSPQDNRGGVYGKHRRTTRAVARSSFIHAATQAREAYFDANREELRGVMWVATLDSHTCPQCAALDGRKWPVMEGPRPPIHHQCRCTTTPVFLGDENPDVPSFSEWLRTQPQSVQEEVLGVARARMWREGRAQITDFVDLEGNILTLDELARFQQ